MSTRHFVPSRAITLGIVACPFIEKIYYDIDAVCSDVLQDIIVVAREYNAVC